jgi:hypothetical protein
MGSCTAGPTRNQHPTAGPERGPADSREPAVGAPAFFAAIGVPGSCLELCEARGAIRQQAREHVVQAARKARVDARACAAWQPPVASRGPVGSDAPRQRRRGPCPHRVPDVHHRTRGRVGRGWTPLTTGIDRCSRTVFVPPTFGSAGAVTPTKYQPRATQASRTLGAPPRGRCPAPGRCGAPAAPDLFSARGRCGHTPQPQ